MKVITALLLAWCSAPVSAAAECQVVDYPDHYEAVCVGNSQTEPRAPQRPRQEETQALARIAEPDQSDVPPEQITLNGLTRSFGAVWLKRADQSR